MHTPEHPTLKSLRTRVHAKPEQPEGASAQCIDGLMAKVPPFNPPAGPEGFDLYAPFLNPLVTSAKPLTGLAIALGGVAAVDDLAALHRKIIAAIEHGVSRVEGLGYDPTHVQMFSYTLCLLLDETIMGQPWGKESFWSQDSLLSRFHHDAHGGENYFTLLDRLMAEPDTYLHVLELAYLCLCIGLKGKYGVVHNAREAISALIKQLYALIDPRRAAIPQHNPLENIVHEPVRMGWRWPWWGSLLVSAAVMVVMFGAFTYRLHLQTEQVVEALQVYRQ